MNIAYRRASTDMLRMLLRTSESRRVRKNAVTELFIRGEASVKECPICSNVMCYRYHMDRAEMKKTAYCPFCGYDVVIE